MTGGIDVAAEWAGFRTVAQVERDPYCLKVLEKHWPGVHRCREIRDFPDQDYGAVTLVSGGFPCQPFSAAGKRRGKEDDRYLWPEMLRVIREIAPKFVLAENVPGLLSIESGLLFESVLNDLEAEGYQTWTGFIPASGVGANHRRERVFIVGHAERRRSQTGDQDQTREKSRDGISSQTSQDVADSRRSGRIQQEESRRETGQRNRNGSQDVADTEDTDGWRADGTDNSRRRNQETGGCCVERTGAEHWSLEPDVGRVASRIPKRVDRLRCLGNAVMPQQVYPILQAIAEVEDEYTLQSIDC